MKVLLLADPASVHTIKWANSLTDKGIEVYLFGLSSFDGSLYNEKIKIETLNTSLKIKLKSDGSFVKIIYLIAVRRIKRLIKIFKPDLLHSHYASSFGFLGALVNFHPYIISVWGADIFNFPEKSRIHKQIIKYSFSKADNILSTSNFMAKQIKKFTNKQVEITPFGIDTNKFTPMIVNSIIKNATFVIGTIKTLEKKYGIEYLIRAFKIVRDNFPTIDLKLLIVGGGSLENQLKELTKKLNINKDVIFTGFIVPEEIPKYHNMIDIYAAFSIEDSESFGVAVLEASACSKPVIVSNVGGFPEVVENGKTGIIVEKGNYILLANALEKLILDSKLRISMGKNGRAKVINEYEWKDSVTKMISIYKKVISQ